jgi:ornithine cyclodeaminase/alanine dehydrogenase-like protein (mu-crystallin family)
LYLNRRKVMANIVESTAEVVTTAAEVVATAGEVVATATKSGNPVIIAAAVGAGVIVVLGGAGYAGYRWFKSRAAKKSVVETEAQPDATIHSVHKAA